MICLIANTSLKKLNGVFVFTPRRYWMNVNWNQNTDYIFAPIDGPTRFQLQIYGLELIVGENAKWLYASAELKNID